MDPLRQAIGNLLEPGTDADAAEGGALEAQLRRHRPARWPAPSSSSTGSCTRRSPCAASSPTWTSATDILSLLLQARDEDGEAMSDERAAGRARDAAAGGPRDHGHLRGLGDRAAGAPPRQARAAVGRDRRGRRGVPGGDRQRDPAGAGRWCRSWCGCCSRTWRWGTCCCRPARGWPRASTSPTATPRSMSSRWRSVPSASWARSPDTFAWIPFGGGIRRCIGASFAQLEMKVMLRTMLGELRPAPSWERCGETASGRVGGRSRSCPQPAREWRGSEGATAAAGDSFPPAMTSRSAAGA